MHFGNDSRWWNIKTVMFLFFKFRLYTSWVLKNCFKIKVTAQYQKRLFCSLTSEVVSRTCWVSSLTTFPDQWLKEQGTYMHIALFCIMGERTKHIHVQRSFHFLAERYKMLAKRLIRKTTGHQPKNWVQINKPVPGRVLGISSDGDDQRIFWGVKFSIPGFFWVRKFGLGNLIWVGIFWGY